MGNLVPIDVEIDFSEVKNETADPAIFDDPILMLQWLEGKPRQDRGLPFQKSSVQARSRFEVHTGNVDAAEDNLAKGPEKRYNKDGSTDKRHGNSITGISCEVYPFTVEEMGKIIKVFNNRIENASDENKRQIARRNKMLFLVGVNIGLRVGDLLPIKVGYFYNDDLTFKEYYQLETKKTRQTGKSVKIYFNQTIKQAVSDYLYEYPVANLDEYLFKSRKGNGHITEKSLWKIIVDVAKDAGIDKNVGSNSLRKTWARLIYDNATNKNKALIMLKECLRHSDSLTTLRFIAVMNEEQTDIYEGIDLNLDFI